jgi:hypothetical protein
MQKVPKGKTVYIGSRRLIEGEALPPHVRIEEISITSKNEIDDQKPKKRKYKSKKRSV